VRKPNGKWRLTVDYRRLNANTGPLTTAVPNVAELISTIQEHGHLILATIDVKDMFFMAPLQPEDQSRFAFTWEFHGCSTHHTTRKQMGSWKEQMVY